MMYQCHIWFTMEHFYIPISYEMRFMRDFSPLSLSISRSLASSLLFSAANFDRQSSFHCTSWFHLMPFLLHSGRIVPHKTVIHRSMNVMDFLLYQYNIALEFIFTSLFWCWCCCCCRREPLLWNTFISDSLLLFQLKIGLSFDWLAGDHFSPSFPFNTADESTSAHDDHSLFIEIYEEIPTNHVT